MKRIKAPESISLGQINTRCWRYVEWSISLAVFAVFLILTLHSSGAGVLEPLFLPFVMALAIGAGLRYQMTGALGISGLLVLIVAYSWLSGVGVFAQGSFGEHLLFAVGLLVLFISITFFCAIIVGYHLRTVDLADEREHLIHRVLDALPIGI